MTVQWERILRALDQTGFMALGLADEGAKDQAAELAAKCKELASLVKDELAGWTGLVTALELVLSKVCEGELAPSESLAQAVARAFEILLGAAEQETADLPAAAQAVLAELSGFLDAAGAEGPARAEGAAAWPCLYEVSLEVPKTATEPNLFAVLAALADAGEVVGLQLERHPASTFLRLRFRVVTLSASEDLEEKLRRSVGTPAGLRLAVVPVFGETCGGEPEQHHGAAGAGDTSAPALEAEEAATLRLILAQQREYLAQAQALGGEARRHVAAASVLARLAAYLGRQDLRRRAEELLRSGEGAGFLGELEGLLAALEKATGTEVPEATPSRRPAAPAAEAPEAPPAAATTRTLRVDEAKVDRLMALAGELVVACNALPYVARRLEVEYAVSRAARELREHHGVLERLARELQDAVMGMRLLPASFVFQKFPRLVRDLARELGKKAELVLEGEDTEIDKSVMQAIGEPLVHLVRNALDHGLEAPEERLRAGKSAAGRLVLRAAREGSMVVLEVEDDGRGIDFERVREKAVAAGLVAAEEAASLSEEEVTEFLFVPGFSTAAQVSSVSGRGVGLDAVRAVVQRLGGSVRVHSLAGHGTTVRLELPLTVATSRVLVVQQGGGRYGLPLQDVREMVKLPAADVRTMRGRRVAVLRGEVVPLVFLGEFLGQAPEPEEAREELCLVVLLAGYALVVDGFIGQEDIVLKPLGQGVGFDPCFAGAAVLGDGGVLLVLDPYRIEANKG